MVFALFFLALHSRFTIFGLVNPGLRFVIRVRVDAHLRDQLVEHTSWGLYHLLGYIGRPSGRTASS